jgi:hypothetical protein
MLQLRHLALIALVSLVAYAGGLIAWFVSIMPEGEDVYLYGALQKANEGARFRGFLLTLALLAVCRLVYGAFNRPDKVVESS